MSAAMAVPLALLLVGCFGPVAANRVTVSLGEDEGELQPESELQLGADASTQENEYCCCKEGMCDPVKKGKDHGIFSPGANLCCMYQNWGCTHPFSNWWYNINKPKAYCKEPQVGGTFKQVKRPASHQPLDLDNLQVGSPAHTVHNYCEDDGSPKQAEQQKLEEEEQETHEEKAYMTKRSELVTGLVSELAKNSIDTMAKELFSIYVCIRWAPDDDFQELASDEINTEQLPGSSPFQLYSESRFIPLRCSRNVPVYNLDEKHGSNFGVFEESMKAISSWLRAEHQSTMQKRLEHLQGLPTGELPEEVKAFDLAHVSQLAQKCAEEGKQDQMKVDMWANAAEFLADCGAVTWWLGKLSEWHAAAPFESFMNPSTEGLSAVAPKKDEHVLICFGKRVASQLHRRAGGSHLLTDQSAVGCHGFWSFMDTGKMIDRIVDLWRPPTCQLARMELDMKVKIMEVIADMNSRLFDALPAIIAEEVEDSDTITAVSKPLQMRNVVMDTGSRIYKFFSHEEKYNRLGQLLGGTVVKWAVCGLKDMPDLETEENLDSVLSTEDPTSKWYAKLAYSKYTGEKELQPGETCVADEGLSKGEISNSQCQACSLGMMEQNHPEPYNNEQFMCPKLPMQPGKPQLEILQKKKGKCFMMMTWNQLEQKKWKFEGHMPHHKQYDLMENIPDKDYHLIKIMSFRERQDATFKISRHWVWYAKTCTPEERELTPRFCQKPKKLQSTVDQLAQKGEDALRMAANVGQTIVSGAMDAYEAASDEPKTGLSGSPPSSQAAKERMAAWSRGKLYSIKRGLKSWSKTWSSRYDRARARMFNEMEAEEVLHSISFQKQLPKTKAHSKEVAQFDRYVVSCDCNGFDPDKEFNLKFQNGERAIGMLTEALKTNPTILSTVGLRVQLMGAASLRFQDVSTATTRSLALYRSGSVVDYKEDGKSWVDWTTTNDPQIQYLAGVMHDRGAHMISASKFNNYEAIFACGTRTQMHHLGTSWFEFPTTVLQPFKECVKAGKVTNQKLREASPWKTFNPDEIVVHVTFRETDMPCYHELFSKTLNPDKPKTTWGEEDHSIYKTFSTAGAFTSCEDVPKEAKSGPHAFPKVLDKIRQDDTYRGIVTGKGVAKDTIEELVMDPEDFLEAIDAKFFQ